MEPFFGITNLGLDKTPPGLDEDANLFLCLKPSRGDDSASLLDLGSPEIRGDKEGDIFDNFHCLIHHVLSI